MTQSTDDLVKRLHDNMCDGCRTGTRHFAAYPAHEICALYRQAADTIERLQRELDETQVTLVTERGKHAEFQRELLARAAALDAARDKTIETLQRALNFWHPGVGGRDDDEFLTRAGDDAMLLFGYMGPSEKSACELGWIAVQDAARSEVKP